MDNSASSAYLELHDYRYHSAGHIQMLSGKYTTLHLNAVRSEMSKPEKYALKNENNKCIKLSA